MVVLIVIFFVQLCSLISPHIVEAESIIVKATPINLDPDRPHRTRFGAMTFLNGFKLSSIDKRFGGLSGLAIQPDGSVLYVVSDHGHALSVRLKHDQQRRLVGFGDWTIMPLKTPGGGVVGGELQDAEALVRKADGSFLVAFEGLHRIWHYPDLLSIPHPILTPPDLQQAPRNGGIEAMAMLPDGRLLVLTEGYKNAHGDYKGWIIHRDRFSPLSYARTRGFKPTDLAVLKHDVFVLERHYFSFFGASVRIRHLAGNHIQAGAHLRGREVLHLQHPLTVDNFEGMAVEDSKRFGTLIYLISDDNFSPLQRTLLLQFRLESSRPE
ncbi:MAG: esterase-like activity of phytase family protein [bacterium]|nr:esterase-like activity of phytase family protein [bacterium]